MDQHSTDPSDWALLLASRKARANAYAPYSMFNVGAAVRTVDGQIVFGCNVENASFGLSMCAERVAIFSAVAQGAERIESLSVTTSCDASQPIEARMPCGACRQVMAQFMDKNAKIIVDDVGVFKVLDLIPVAFEFGESA